MFRMIFGCVLYSTPRQHEASVCTHGLHKTTHTRSIGSSTEPNRLDNLFLGKTLPAPAWDESKTVLPQIGIYQVADVVGHRRGRRRHSFQYALYPSSTTLKGFGPAADLESRAHQVPQCKKNIAAYRAQRQLDKIMHSPCNQRKYFPSKDASPLGSDTTPKDGSPVKENPPLASANPDLVRI